MDLRWHRGPGSCIALHCKSYEKIYLNKLFRMVSLLVTLMIMMTIFIVLIININSYLFNHFRLDCAGCSARQLSMVNCVQGAEVIGECSKSKRSWLCQDFPQMHNTQWSRGRRVTKNIYEGCSSLWPCCGNH